ncbi:MAG: hypothetical protein F6K14_33515, partial [Symploca sp. SIO2C1]|nr:hypothetical protein [Symploca sp. SIO2C1]
KDKDGLGKYAPLENEYAKVLGHIAIAEYACRSKDKELKDFIVNAIRAIVLLGVKSNDWPDGSEQRDIGMKVLNSFLHIIGMVDKEVANKEADIYLLEPQREVKAESTETEKVYKDPPIWQYWTANYEKCGKALAKVLRNASEVAKYSNIQVELLLNQVSEAYATIEQHRGLSEAQLMSEDAGIKAINRYRESKMEEAIKANKGPLLVRVGEYHLKGLKEQMSGEDICFITSITEFITRMEEWTKA